jgi:hypothetical protein
MGSCVKFQFRGRSCNKRTSPGARGEYRYAGIEDMIVNVYEAARVKGESMLRKQDKGSRKNHAEMSEVMVTVCASLFTK